MSVFKRLRTIADPTLARVQDSIAEAFAALERSPLAGAVLLENVEVLTGVQDIPHGLGRPVRAFILAGANAQVTIWQSGESPAPNKLLRLEASADATINLLVF